MIYHKGHIFFGCIAGIFLTVRSLSSTIEQQAIHLLRVYISAVCWEYWKVTMSVFKAMSVTRRAWPSQVRLIATILCFLLCCAVVIPGILLTQLGSIAALFCIPVVVASWCFQRRGLYICKQLGEAMGGSIWVESADIPGQGSCFSFTLPRALPEKSNVTPSSDGAQKALP